MALKLSDLRQIFDSEKRGTVKPPRFDVDYATRKLIITEYPPNGCERRIYFNKVGKRWELNYAETFSVH